MSSVTESLPPDPQQDLRSMANAIRALSMDAVQKANSGHPGMPMGMADVATVLFTKFLKCHPEDPLWPDRDRFVLSAGHGSMLQYALLYLMGYEKITLDEIKNFRQLHALTAGHPEVDHEAGIEITTGPLGQGLSTAVGMAVAERILNARFGNDLINHKTYVIASDGDMMEGISHEACSLAGHLGLHQLIVLYDDNGISIDGPTNLSFSDDTIKRFESYGWKTLYVDGHDFEAIERALAQAHQEVDRPVLISCKTKIGFGAPTKENTSSSHGSPLGEEEITGTRQKLGWTAEPFDIPKDIMREWRKAGLKNFEDYRKWQDRFDMLDDNKKEIFLQVLSGNIQDHINPLINTVKKAASKEKPKLATRKASGKVLEALVPETSEMIGGSADLTGSNITKINDAIIQKGHFNGQYIYYGVREHGMTAIMNGMALHGGIIPYGGTFLSFADYSRPAIRLCALMKQRVVHVMTHDSIGLGEDGPTHQPVEHIAALRAIPNCYVYRPADLVETAECWQLALEKQDAPSILALTRQGLPTVRLDHDENNLSAKGAYILRDANINHEATIFASGSEVEIALQASDDLEKQGIGTRVISVPCMDLLLEQPTSYLKELQGEGTILAAVEAAIRQGWDAIIGSDGLFVGMNSFGESAPYQDLYNHFGITADSITQTIKHAKQER